jgi:hypothetical protein
MGVYVLYAIYTQSSWSKEIIIIIIPVIISMYSWNKYDIYYSHDLVYTTAFSTRVVFFPHYDGEGVCEEIQFYFYLIYFCLIMIIEINISISVFFLFMPL